MFNVKKYKKMMLSTSVIFALAIAAAVFAINKIGGVQNTFAATMPEGFDDQNFYDCVLEEFQSEYPNESVASSGLTLTQLGKIKKLSCIGENLEDSEKITSTAGLENLTGLMNLVIYDNKITSLDVSKNTALNTLSAGDNQLTSLDVSKNTALTKLLVGHNQLTSLDVSKNTALVDLRVHENKLTSLDLSKNTALIILFVNNNQLTSLDVSKNTALATLSAWVNKLTSLDVSKNTELSNISVRDNKLTSLDVSRNTKLESLVAYNNQISELDVSNNKNLNDLYADNILITAGIEDMSLKSGQAKFDLSNVKFISEEGNATINNTENYTYNSATKLLAVKDFSKTKGFVMVSPIDITQKQGEYKNYKLKIGEVDSAKVDSTNSDDNVLPYTPETPNTGIITSDDNKSELYWGVALPAAVVVMVLMCVAGHRYIVRKRINW